jgi:hypothetical protein
MPKSKLRLGDVLFEGFEVPEDLFGIGGVQQLKVHNYVGSNKAVQVLGPKPGDITWQGRFLYQNATLRALQVDEYRKTGEVVRLSWDIFAYEVVVKKFEAKPKGQFDIPYAIELEVVRDFTASPPLNEITPDEGIINSLNRADESLEPLSLDENFEQQPLPNGTILPEDSETVIAFLKDDIDIRIPEQPTDVIGSPG